jgi:hypothetical protein
MRWPWTHCTESRALQEAADEEKVQQRLARQRLLETTATRQVQLDEARRNVGSHWTSHPQIGGYRRCR